MIALSPFGPVRLHQKHAWHSPRAIIPAEEAHESMHLLHAEEVLREQVRGIYLAVDLPRGDSARPHLLLHPQGMGLELSQLAQFSAGRESEDWIGVSPCAPWRRQPHVSHQRLPSQAAPADLTKP